MDAKEMELSVEAAPSSFSLLAQLSLAQLSLASFSLGGIGGVAVASGSL